MLAPRGRCCFYRGLRRAPSATYNWRLLAFTVTRLAHDINPGVVALLEVGLATGAESSPNFGAFTEAKYEEHAASSKDTGREGSAELRPRDHQNQHLV